MRVVFRGKRDGEDKPVVTRNGKVFTAAASQRLWNHSPCGFEWSYGGSGPAQLALAILLSVTRDRDRAVYLHQAFKREYVSQWPREYWEVTAEEVLGWINRQPVQDGEEVL